jgi:hypothetical protein
MKTLIAASLLLALTSPAFAYGSSDQWDCGNKIEITGWKGQITVAIGGDPAQDKEEYTGAPTKGSFNLRWDMNKAAYWLNGKACMHISDKLHWTKYCAAGDKESCEELAKGWLMTPAQVKRAVDRWKTTWPGNTVKKHR